MWTYYVCISGILILELIWILRKDALLISVSTLLSESQTRGCHFKVKFKALITYLEISRVSKEDTSSWRILDQMFYKMPLKYKITSLTIPLNRGSWALTNHTIHQTEYESTIILVCLWSLNDWRIEAIGRKIFFLRLIIIFIYKRESIVIMRFSGVFVITLLWNEWSPLAGWPQCLTSTNNPEAIWVFHGFSKWLICSVN